MVDNTALERFSSKYSAFPSKNNSSVSPFSLCRGACDKDVLSFCYLQLFNQSSIINLLTPNVNYSGRTAPLTSKVAFYIFIQQI